jgi:uncharacterized OB-fold protein
MTATQTASAHGIPTPAKDVDLDSWRLIGNECPECGIVAYPPLNQCPSCWGVLQRRILSANGRLYSYSIVHVAAVSRPAPYAVGYVDLPEGVRVFAHLAETDELLLRPDLPVSIHLVPAGEDYLTSWKLDDGEGQVDEDA